MYFVFGDEVHGPDGAIDKDLRNPSYLDYLRHLDPEFDLRSALKDAVTAKRYELECGGIVLPGGTRLDTSREDQNAVANAIALTDIAGVTSVDFKAASGWISITIAQLKQIGAAIGRHKQACYSAERAHHEAIDALQNEGLDAYDLEAGWPTGADAISVPMEA